MEFPYDPSTALSLCNLLLTRRGMTFAYFDSDLRIRLAGPGIDAYIEEKPRAVVGSYLPDLFVEFLGMENALRAVLRGESEEISLSPVARETSEGQTRYLAFQVWRVEDNPQAPGLLLIEDVTPVGELEQRLVQQRNELYLLRAELERTNANLRHLNQFKSLMLSIAAHDLRSPLSALFARLDILLKDVQTGRQIIPWTETLQWMQSSVSRMNNIIAGLLDYVQAEEGRLALRFTTCDLALIVQKTVRLLPPEIANRIEIKTRAKPKLIADSEGLQRVFYNLIDNALKYTSSNQPITVVIRRQDKWAVVDVSDRGKGMTPEEVARLFQRYYRTEEARQGGIIGTGLGLFIVKTLVEAHGGRVEVESELNRGTTFHVYLPLQK